MPLLFVSLNAFRSLICALTAPCGLKCPTYSAIQGLSCSPPLSPHACPTPSLQRSRAPTCLGILSTLHLTVTHPLQNSRARRLPPLSLFACTLAPCSGQGFNTPRHPSPVHLILHQQQGQGVTAGGRDEGSMGGAGVVGGLQLHNCMAGQQQGEGLGVVVVGGGGGGRRDEGLMRGAAVAGRLQLHN